jgi:transposase-like protein
MAMSMKQRGERRRQMALEVVQGAEIAEVSLRYGVKPPTVYEAWRKYRDELQALARQQVGPEASRNGSQQATTTVV